MKKNKPVCIPKQLLKNIVDVVVDVDVDDCVVVVNVVVVIVFYIRTNENNLL